MTLDFREKFQRAAQKNILIGTVCKNEVYFGKKLIETSFMFMPECGEGFESFKVEDLADLARGISLSRFPFDEIINISEISIKRFFDPRFTNGEKTTILMLPLTLEEMSQLALLF
jgi:hypothetical protein